MSKKIISYDLGQPETSANYRELIDYIKSIGTWVKPLESFWIVDTTKQCSTIRNEAKQYLDANDRLFVVTCPFDDWASYRISSTVTDFIQ